MNRSDINKRIAFAMGLQTEPVECTLITPGIMIDQWTSIHDSMPDTQFPPDFFTDPAAFMALWEWLRKVKRWEIGINVEGRGLVDVHVADLDCQRCGIIGNEFDDNIMVALALTVYAALNKSEKK